MCKKGPERICIFYLLIYVSYWLTMIHALENTCMSITCIVSWPECMRTCFFMWGEYVTHWEIWGFSQVFRWIGVIWELGQYDLYSLFYILLGLYVSTIWPMEPACVGYTPGPPENWMLPQVGQDDLFEALEVKLGHSDLFKNISPMQRNLKVKPTSNYSLGMALQVYIKIRSCWPN